MTTPVPATAPWSAFTADQHRAAFLIDRPVLAAAGAGAGKTAVMAVRYAAALLDHDDGQRVGPERILAVAFTREAAANLRARIDRTLRVAVALRRFPLLVAGEGVIEADLDEGALAHLRRSLDALPGAPIATFDALCLTWVAEHAAVLGHDPDLRPPEELAWARARDEAWSALRREELRGEHADLLTLAAAYSETAVRAMVRAAADQAAALPEPLLHARGGDPVAATLALRAAALDAVVDALVAAQGCAGANKTLAAIRAIAPQPPRGQLGLRDWIGELDALSVPGGSKDEALKQAIRDINDGLALPTQRSANDRRPGAAARRRFASLAAIAGWHPELEASLQQRAGAVARLAARWLAHLDACAARAGLAGFARVEADALRLLDDPIARARIGGRYRHVLLDEAQDLNRLQGRIIDRLRQGGAARVFVVGDHRQSIFAFRHAEPAIFAGWQATIVAADGASVDLARNFRSHPALLAAVRGLFIQPSLALAFRAEGITAGRAAEDFPHPGLLRGWRVGARRDGQAVELRAGGLAASEAMARHVAALVAHSIAAGRAAEDHAVLLRTRSRMRLYAGALEQAGIAYDTDFPGGLYDSQECHDAEAVIRLCLNPHDRRALAIALGGPWGAADPQDRRLMVEALEQDPAAGWRWAAERAPIGALVDDLRPLLAGEGVAAVLRRLATDPRVAARYARLPLARRRLANLAYLADEEARAGIALDGPAFIDRLHERRRLGADDEEAVGERLGSRGVRLMTIHGAKGLEWPVVLLPDLDRAMGSRDVRGPLLALADDGGLGLACTPGDSDRDGDDDPVGLRAGLIADEKRQRVQAEESRLFYVACTRAEEELYVVIASDVHGPRADGSVACHADWLEGAGLAWEDALIDLDPPSMPVAMASSTRDRLPPLSAAVRAEIPVTAVTDLPGDLAGDGPPQQAAHAPGRARSRTQAQAIGVALHDALARHGPGMSPAQAAAGLAPVAAYLDGARHARLVAHLGRSDLVPGYWSAAMRLHEQPVIGEDAAGLVVGVCDLLLKDGSGAWRLYDYKSGAAADAPSSRAQVARYAALVRPHLDGPLIAAGIVDVERGVIVPVDAPDGDRGGVG